MKTKTTIILSALLVSSAYLVSVRGKAPEQKSDFRDAVADDLGRFAVKTPPEPVAAKAEAEEKTGANFAYQCSSLDENAPYLIKKIALKVNGRNKPLLFSFTASKDVTEQYVIDETYRPKPGSSMTGFLRLDIKNAHHDAYGEGALTPFYLQEELMTGGYLLKSGKTGGFIKVAGAGYSWARYICAR